MFKQYQHFSWNNYYRNNDQIEEIKNKQFTSGENSLNLNSGNCYVYYCYFQYLTASSGAAILCSLESNLLVEKCSIYNCSATYYTAGIRVSAGNCVIAFVCSQKGYAGHSDGFSAVWDDSNREINSVFDSSISHCEAKSYYTMYHEKGHVYIKSLNLSYNKANERSVLCCWPIKINEETKHGIDVLYCSFSNNTSITQHQ